MTLKGENRKRMSRVAKINNLVTKGFCWFPLACEKYGSNITSTKEPWLDRVPRTEFESSRRIFYKSYKTRENYIFKNQERAQQ